MMASWPLQLNQLAYFVAVAEERLFTRAAERVGVAQPSLSQQMKALESDLGAVLRAPGPRGQVGLTASGETLLPVARRMLADAETARREIRELAALGARPGPARRHPEPVHPAAPGRARRRTARHTRASNRGARRRLAGSAAQT